MSARFTRWRRLAVWIAMAAGAGVGLGAAQPEVKRAADPFAAAGPVQEGVVQIGLVTVDAKSREIRIPARLNMAEGPIEYLVVHSTGKVHESIFKTDAEPSHVHAGVLLLHRTNFPPVEIEVVWAGKTNAGGQLIRNVDKNGPLSTNLWTYAGSRMADGVFMAQREGSIVAVRADPEALIESRDPQRVNDEIWQPWKERLPGEEEAITIIFRFKEVSEK